MGRRFSKLCAGLSLLTGLTAMGAAPSRLFLPGPHQQKAVPGAFSRNRTIPVASNGYLLSHALTIRGSGSDSVALTSLQTGDQKMFSFWLQEASSIRLQSGTVTPKGHVLLAGSYEKSPEDLNRVNFVSEMDSKGTVVGTHSLGDFTPERICTVSDGSYWAFGQDLVKEGRGQDYSMLRRYSAAGELQGSYFPRSSLHTKMALNYQARGPKANKAFLACGETSVAAYVGRGTPVFVWTEVDTTTGTTEQFAVRRVSGAAVTGLTLTSKHSGFVSLNPGGLYRLVPDQAKSAAWMPVPVGATEDNREFTTLLGRDGSSLVHLKQGSALQAKPVVYWSRLSDGSGN